MLYGMLISAIEESGSILQSANYTAQTTVQVGDGVFTETVDQQ